MTLQGKRYQLAPFGRWLVRTGRRLDDVKTAELEEYFQGLSCCREQKKNIAATIRQLYAFHNVNHNPALSLEVGASGHRRLQKPPSAPVLSRIIESVSGCDPLVVLRDRLLLELAYGSALRRRELLRLNVEDLDLSDSVAIVTGKGGKSRMVPLTALSCRLLQRYLAIRKVRRGPLLVNLQTGRRLSLQHVSKICRQRTGLNTHLFRHACATHLLQNGCDLRLVQELLGHAKIDTTGVYTHLNRTDLQRVLARCHLRNRKDGEA